MTMAIPWSLLYLVSHMMTFIACKRIWHQHDMWPQVLVFGSALDFNMAPVTSCVYILLSTNLPHFSLFAVIVILPAISCSQLSPVSVLFSTNLPAVTCNFVPTPVISAAQHLLACHCMQPLQSPVTSVIATQHQLACRHLQPLLVTCHSSILKILLCRPHILVCL